MASNSCQKTMVCSFHVFLLATFASAASPGKSGRFSDARGVSVSVVNPASGVVEELDLIEAPEGGPVVEPAANIDTLLQVHTAGAASAAAAAAAAAATKDDAAAISAATSLEAGKADRRRMEQRTAKDGVDAKMELELTLRDRLLRRLVRHAREHRRR